ncbi:MAG: T9SS type A sorting domain-containing protein, partial [Cytophagales bacterium]|nr:T9SS type A sorting domain-containing protein [Cytophagales bacterium]
GGTGAADASWNPNANDAVFALTLSGTDLYVGGDFTQIGGQSRNYVAKLSAATGLADGSWHPNGNNAVLGIGLSAGGSAFIGGLFTSMGGNPLQRLAKVSTSNKGELDATWKYNTNSHTYSLKVDNDELYVGGLFTNVAGQQLNKFAMLPITPKILANPMVLNSASGSTVWQVVPNPSKGTFCLHGRCMSGTAEVVISDLQGRIISQFQTKNVQISESIDLSHMSRGVYVLQVYSSEGKLWTEKLLKE